MKKPYSMFDIQRSIRSRGFALLFAAIIASVVLALGTAIFDISIKQVELSSASRQSQYAFYAADTAANCALYWDERFSEFATVTPSLSPAPNCDGQNLTVTTGQVVAISKTYTSAQPATYPYSQTFQFAPNGYCAQVTVTKNEIGSVASTTIQASGYDTNCSNLDSNTTLQRTVQLNY